MEPLASGGVSMRSPGLGPFTPASPLPSMDVLMQSPGLYDSPGQGAKVPNETAPAVKQSMADEEAIGKLDRAQLLIDGVRKGAEGLVAALRETAALARTNELEKKAKNEEGPTAKRARTEAAEKSEEDNEGDAGATPVAQVLKGVEKALAELAEIAGELTAGGVSFEEGAERRIQPDADFAKRKWDALVAERKAENDLEHAQAALKKLYLQLRRRYTEDRELVWELDRVIKDLDASNPDKVSQVLGALKEAGLFPEKDGEGQESHSSLIEQLQRTEKSVPEMLLSLVGDKGTLVWQSALSESKVDGSGQSEFNLDVRPTMLSCLLPDILRATVGLSREGDPMTVSVTAAVQVPGQAAGPGPHVFSEVTKVATSALYYFKRQRAHTALHRFLVWLYSYRSLFMASCGACGKVLALDPRSNILLPPLLRPYKAIITSGEEREAVHPFCHLQRTAYF